MKFLFTVIIFSGLILSSCSTNNTGSISNKETAPVVYDKAESYDQDLVINADAANYGEVRLDMMAYKDEMKEAYEFIKNTPATIKIDGVEGEFDMTENSLLMNFGLQIIEENQMDDFTVHKIYQNANGKTFNAEQNNDGYIINLYKLKDINIELPYGVSTSKSFEDNRTSIDPRADFSAISGVENILHFDAGNTLFVLWTEGADDYRLQLTPADDTGIKADIISRAYVENIPADNKGEITLDNKKIKFPIGVFELEKIMAGSIENPTKENISKVQNIDNYKNINEHYSYEFSRVLDTKSGTYIIDTIPNYMYDDAINQSYREEMVETLWLGLDSDFSFKNDEVEINKNNYQEFYEKISGLKQFKDYQITVPHYYLDDNTMVMLAKDIVWVNKSDKLTRNLMEVNSILYGGELDKYFE